MNIIHPSAPFCSTRQLFAWQTHQWQTSSNLLELAKSIVKIALSVLAYPLMFVNDLALIPIARLIDRCCATRCWTLNSQGKRIPTASYSRIVLDDNFSLSPYSNNTDFLINALQKTFYYNTSELTAHYKQQINSQRLLEDENPTDIHLYSAKWLLAHYLLVKNVLTPEAQNLYPAIHPHRDIPYLGNVEEGQPRRDDAGIHEHDVARLWRVYQSLNEKDRACVLLQIRTPSIQWELSDAAQILATDIHELALEMVADHAFLEIYRAVAPHVNNIVPY